jgi:ectoine hydroxylase-related dioxygenase (phytanoyl-CoA dioxygenase family)
MFTVKARSLHHELSDGFDVLRERGKGRYDMELPEFDTEEYSFLTDSKNAAWMPIIHKILGDDAILVHKGCFLSLPGSETQVYHQDGVHLNKNFQKPCHAVNVFIPLVDYDMTNGPTEFCLGSHYLGHENFVKDMVGGFVADEYH